MRNKKFNKLISALLVALGLFSSASICAAAAQIDALSVIDNKVYASISGGDATLFAAEYDGGLLSDAFFAKSSEGYVELPVGNGNEYKLFLWDRESLAPVSCSYNLIDGKAYAHNSSKALPELFSFNEEDSVTVVASISETELTGFKAGEEISIPLANNVHVFGLSDNIADVTPGSVVFIGESTDGKCAAIQLLATIGTPVNGETFKSHFGVYDDLFGTGKYSNVVGEMFGKMGTTMQVKIDSEGTKETCQFTSTKTMCYKVNISVSEDGVSVSCDGGKVNASPSIFGDTSKEHNYLYLRRNNETGKITQCVYYIVSKNLDFTDPDYPIEPFGKK